MKTLQLSKSTLLTRREVAEARRVPLIEVKRAFVIASRGRDLFERKKNPTRREIEEIYKKACKDFEYLSESELNWCISEAERLQQAKVELNWCISDSRYLERYNRMEWHKGSVPLNKMGPWPGMREISLSLTTGNVIETAQQIRATQNGNIPQGLLNCLDSIQTHIDFIRPHLPLILVPGGELRGKTYLSWARTVNANAPLCSQFPYDIDDGSMRAVAYALAGFEDAPVYIGKYPTQAKITPRLNGITKRK